MLLLRAALVLSIGFINLGNLPAYAADRCQVKDRDCVLHELESSADKIDNQAWKDQTFRELAKTLAFDGHIDDAIALIEKIEKPDTKAMTIRGIGMAAADNQYDQARYDEIWAKLRTAAEKIEHPPSYAIALTYIAMAQAFAKDNEGAWKTAADMENDALRHKAYGETAEIQAEHGDFKAAMKSISLIDSKAYRNKAYSTVCHILADRDLFQEAFEAAQEIDNAYKRAEALQYVLDKQKPREIPY